MKKVIIFMFMLIMPLTVSAATYNVQDMTVTIDDKYLVLTPENINDSEVLKDAGIDPSTVQKQFSSKL